MQSEFVLANAQLALPGHIALGWVGVQNGNIAEIGTGKPPTGAVDLEGDMIVPGLVELHTDHLEAHLKPRPKVSWPEQSAILAYDAQIAAAGITTVFDCLRAGRDADYIPVANEIANIASALKSAAARQLLRVDHRIHLRCEVCADDVIDEAKSVLSDFRVDLISLMDHTPGARQFTSLEAWRTYYGGKSGLSVSELDNLIARKHDQFERNYHRYREQLVTLAQANNIVLASHDDALSAHVKESIADGVAIAEFPTTIEAARLCHESGIDVMMGAPNVVRGGSHSGNVAASDLAEAGYLNVLSSDYVPASLLLGAFELARRIDGYDLSRALETVTRNPARSAGLDDRGTLEVGKRADLIRVHVAGDLPVVREVFCGGRRVI